MPLEYTVRWTGGPIGVGASVLHFVSVGSSASAQAVADATRVCFEAIKGQIPTAVSISYDAEVREISNAGALVAVYPVTAPLVTTPTGVGPYAAGTGAMVRHSTGIVVGGKRLQGRTFIVPILSSNYSSVGSIAGGTQTTISNAFTALRTTTAGVGSSLAVWSRANASTAAVTGSACLGRVSALRTRNDRL